MTVIIVSYVIIIKVSRSLTLCTPPDATANPHAGIQVQVPWIPSLHVDVDSEAIRLRVNLIGLCGVV